MRRIEMRPFEIRHRHVLAASCVLVLASSLAGKPSSETPGADSPREQESTAVASAATTQAADATSRHPLAKTAEERFFAIFNHRPEEPQAALSDLMSAYAVDPGDARTNLLLGLNHLWLAAEGNRRDARIIEHLYLAEGFLARAQRLDPTDLRLASWLIPARQALASIEHRFEDLPQLAQEMIDAYETDPNFHSFVVGLQAFAEPVDSPRFQHALEVMRQAGQCLGEEDPSCANRPHWPHNVEAFLVLVADYELKAGNTERAGEVLEQVRTHPDFASWPFRDEALQRLAELQERAARFANDDEEDDPPTLFAGAKSIGCQACHLASSQQ